MNLLFFLELQVSMIVMLFKEHSLQFTILLFTNVICFHVKLILLVYSSIWDMKFINPVDKTSNLEKNYFNWQTPPP